MYEHDHSHHDHSSKHLLGALLVTIGFAGVEALTGWWSHSLALVGDAGHMITDAVALGFAALAARLAQKPASETHSFGLGRAEVLAALLNALFMLGIVGGITWGAIVRLQSPGEVHGGAVMIVAGIGLLVNVVVAWVLHRGEQTMNTRGALLHVMGDLLGSVAALVAGGVIYFTGWTPIDPILSIFISALILVSAIRLLLESLHVVMEGVPPGIDLATVGRSMARVAGVKSIHDLHIWRLDSHTVSLSAHVVVENLEAWQGVLIGLREHLLHTYGIDHITLQPEPDVVVRVPVEQLKTRQS